MKKDLLNKIIKAYSADKEILCSKSEVDKVLGHNPDYLLEVHGITKNDLIRLERLGFALKARYAVRHPKQDLYDKLNRGKDMKEHLVCKTGTHRTRWIIFQEVLDASC